MLTGILNFFMKIDIYTHFFLVKVNPGVELELTLRFANRFVLYGYNDKERKNGYNFFHCDLKTNVFRFILGQFELFKRFILEHAGLENNLEINKYEPPDYDIVKMKLKSTYTLRDYQERAKNFITNNNPDLPRTRFIGIRTGFGKGIISMAALSVVPKRMIIYVLARYTKKWADELVQKTNIKPLEILIIKGSSSLLSLYENDNIEFKNIKVFIISVETKSVFIKEYQDNPSYIENNLTPTDIYSKLNIGSVIIDETHQHLHSVFSIILYMHVDLLLTMSATLISRNQDILKMQRLMYPEKIRYNELIDIKYVRFAGFSYNLDPNRKMTLKWNLRFRTEYNQGAFEQSIIKDKRVLFSYLKFIYRLCELAYLKEFMSGDKLLVYAYRTEMCKIIKEYLKVKMPDKRINTFIMGDKEEVLYNSDVIVSTIGSCGTNWDIKGLRAIVMTDNRDSPVDNEQAAGRLRFSEDRDMKFFFMYCNQIPQHVKYAKNKYELFSKYALSIGDYIADTAI